ncbi:MAG: hypothetical protein H7A23_13400 [Leptospiraceae bacterium]|nr:hypothetical protein [Leptospiraceae bacterium]MCP5495546.1 hypothetical protein [Leptospiraceae bacterium]
MIFSEFDMVVGGLTKQSQTNHYYLIAKMAMDIQKTMIRLKQSRENVR